ncbi:MAG: hypothetical protein COU07_01930 [Candidatus Harrisonbacteria bacterium CG10_big_fil_rev_8_21_14_0_10_40_38]|uniref:Uncharacterized protein n=1 Tax=Candidatus Harrisonbacteria bacterium CG10_big_fil_rev_8_21_14_0_10_40_38 TaxID=1974583 RepID=A0A2H0UT91_9BACT|nr:MAG: hypothetical protein COU07_01930 [Candidatus Harrisonbacteria bacterium CG10_big_fil_rev_8_21_14_0_10_40_38]
MKFGFAAVPFKQDGYMHELFKDEPGVDDPKEGVVLLDTKGEDDLSIGYLGFNIYGVRAMNEMTQGAFLELCEGDENQRYILLEPRKQHLARLREMLPNLPEDIGWQRELKKRLACLLDNTDAYLAEHGARAVMLIY